MKTLLLFLLLAASGGAGYMVWGRHDGDVRAAWTEAARLAGIAAEAPAQAEREPAVQEQGGQRRRSGAGGGGQRRPTAVISAVAGEADLPILRASVGWIEPLATVIVRARIDGVIVEQRVRDGQMVKKDDVLFVIDPREAQAQLAQNEAAVARDRATLVNAQAALERVRQLVSRNVSTQVQGDQAEADASVAQANLAASEAALQANRLKLDYATVKAPLDGRLGVVRVTPGNLVRGSDSSGDGLVTITQMTPLRVSFTLPERDLTLLREALDRKDAAQIKVFVSESPQPTATGDLTFIDSSVDVASGTIAARALLPNEDGVLWPGQYVRVEAELGVRPKATTVPVVAIQPGQDGSYIFVINKENRAERRKVEIADMRGDVAAISLGVSPGDRVVVEGQLRLRDKAPVIEKTPEEAAETVAAGERRPSSQEGAPQ